MPTFVIPPLVKFALGALGAGAIAHWMVNEIRRINAELDRMKTVAVVDPVARQELPTLRRDPRSGEWRVM
jgi:hypothetical protein